MPACVLLLHAVAAPAVYPDAGALGLLAVFAAPCSAVLVLVVFALLWLRDRDIRALLGRKDQGLVSARERANALESERVRAQHGERLAAEAARRSERQMVEQAVLHASSAEAVRQALVFLVERQLPAVVEGTPAPPLVLSEDVADRATAELVEETVADVLRLVGREAGRRETMRLVVVALARRLQASALEIYGEAIQMPPHVQQDPGLLKANLHVQHAAMQQARRAQSVVTLAGEWPGQQWQDDVPLVDVVRSAAGRITSYQRVQVTGNREIAITAAVVEPVIHTMAELLANAAQSSPATTAVQVQVREVQRGAVIEVDDAGLGLRDHELSAYREIASGHRLVALEEMGAVPQTGLAVVGQYARRHGLGVDLAESPYGGIRAVVLIPGELLTTVPLPAYPDQHAPAPESTVPEPPPPGPAAAEGGRRESKELSAGAPGPADPDPTQTVDGLPQRRHRRGAGAPVAPPSPAGPSAERERTPAEEAAWTAAYMTGTPTRPDTPEPGPTPGSDLKDDHV
ncbi:ATP-binding protein [Actinomadura sp. 7K507]|uniref:ATP-binding protein n=1 Tax=Actinomadura sp. 7K507 TaxID=2530365 RepID=UPI00104A4844|nr:ATP-binding protein [Actinomadura sp. 7K507]TDC81847.1 ATP-binding protein [Actinomadura sp. 7K507]